MANRERGEVSIEISGRTYTLDLTLDAMASVEDLFSTPQREVTFQQVAERAEAGSMRHLKGYLWALLREHQPDVKITDVSRLVKEAGGLAVITAALLRVANAAVPDEKDLAELGIDGKANPLSAQTVNPAGTGESSGSKPVAVA